MIAPNPRRTLAMVSVIVLLVAGYEIVGITLRIPALYMGFLFATYWGAIRGLTLPDWLPSLLGALFGIALAYLLHRLPLAFGGVGLVVAIAATLVPMYLLIRQRLSLIINPGFLVFLTVATIPALAAQDDHLGMAMGAAFGAAYTGAIVLLLRRIAGWRAARAAVRAIGSA